MHRRDIYYFTGLVCIVASVICAVQGYYLPAVITGLLAHITTSLSVKNGKGALGVYTFITFSIAYGFIVAPTHYTLPAAMFFLALIPTIRLLFFSALGHNQQTYVEVVLFLTGLALFIGGNIYYHAGWEEWTFPGLAFLLGLVLTAIFTMGNVEVKIKVRDFFGVKTGSKAPDFSLNDQDGNKVSLSDFKGKRHSLIVFVRGDWCPTCHIMLRTYEKYKEKFAEKNVMLLGIGPDPVGVNKAMMERLGLDYKMLSDDKAEAAKAYGMMFQKSNPDAKFQEGIPLPAAFLIDINGVIAYTSNPKKPGEILRPETIFPVLEKLQAA